MSQTTSVMKAQQSVLPKSPELQHSLERTLLTDVLRKFENDPWIKITNIELTKACNAGDNYMSTIQRAYVEGVYSNSTYFSKQFILKRQMEDQERRKIYMADQTWTNEEHMYFTVLPRLRRHCTLDLPHPRLYHSDDDIMVIEDLKETGYTMTDRLEGMDLEHSLLVMKNIAQFHSASLAMQRLDPEIFNIMKTNFKHPYNGPKSYELGLYLIQQGLKDSKTIIETAKLENNNNIIGCLESLEKNIQAQLSFLIEPPTSELTVLIHGDLWVNNILFCNDHSTNKPKYVKFVDFQATRFGSIALDLLHFLFTSVQPAIRRKYINVLLRFYYDSLIGYLKNFLGSENSDYITNLTFERIQDEIEKYRIYGLVNAILTLPVVTCDSKSVSTNDENKMKNGNSQTTKFRERLIEVVETYVENNWISKD